MDPQLKDIVEIREYLPGDKEFIIATFLNSLYYGGSIYSNSEKQDFMKFYHPVAEFLVDKRSGNIKVACLKEDKDVIVGYCLFTPKAIHWVYVKPGWRRMGIAKALAPEDVVAFTHFSKDGLVISEKKGWTYHPLLI